MKTTETPEKMTFEDLCPEHKHALIAFEKFAGHIIANALPKLSIHQHLAPKFEIVYTNRGAEAFFKHSDDGFDFEVSLNTADDCADLSIDKKMLFYGPAQNAVWFLEKLSRFITI